MDNNFQQTVDLREKIERRRTAAPKKTVSPIEKIYEPADEGEFPAGLKKISRPKIYESPVGLIRLIVFILAVIVVGATVYMLFFRQNNSDSAAKDKNWYAVKLVSGDIFYGQITDVKADPVSMAKVYYNYDQAKPGDAVKNTDKSLSDTGNIRLVKSGQETYGPNGTMLLYHAQVLIMEPLKADSKVLKAILDYEK